MIEYPSIINSSKAPRELCIAFDKLDGSNIRIKFTPKLGFNLFGSRTQLIDSNHPFLGKVIDIFKTECEDRIYQVIKNNWTNEREIIIFGEFYGPNSFAGLHQPDDPHTFTMFDLMIGHKNRKFLLPQEFIKLFSGVVEIPRVIYEGNLNDQFIVDVKSGKYDVIEGVVCKGKQRRGDYRGGVWSCKIKTQKYLGLLKQKFGDEGLKRYGE